MNWRVELPPLGFGALWREAARHLASHDAAPAQVSWSRDPAPELFASAPPPAAPGPHPVRAPKALIQLLTCAIQHSDPAAPGAAYALLHRHQRDAALWRAPADPLTRRVETLAKAVRRDLHKMHAFVRFRELPGTEARRRFGAWFEPDHFILEQGASFFRRRFGDMDWMICTPQGVARFEAGALRLGPAMARPDLGEDDSEALWATYFQNIFNPARIHLKAMQSEMPRKYWKNLPETRLIPGMLQAAEARVERMRAAAPSAAPKRAARILARQQPTLMPEAPASLADAERAAKRCARCDLCCAATQTVWGAGDPDAALMLVGEQPGDREDLEGRPFVGPAGRLLRAAMAEADLGAVWMTNAVKHFRFKPRGKARLHQRPDAGHIERCRWWLGLERRFVAPKLTVALGATAAAALTGDGARIGARRGGWERAFDGGLVLISWHPSYILRAPAPAAAQARAELVEDLRAARREEAGLS